MEPHVDRFAGDWLFDYALGILHNGVDFWKLNIVENGSKIGCFAEFRNENQELKALNFFADSGYDSFPIQGKIFVCYLKVSEFVEHFTFVCLFFKLLEFYSFQNSSYD